jgi:hypothetical protein
MPSRRISIAPMTSSAVFAGADLVKEADGGLVEDPRDRGALMRARRERLREAGQRQALALGGVIA